MRGGIESRQVLTNNITKTVQVAKGQWQLSCPRCGDTNLQVQSGNKVVSSVSTGRRFGEKSAIAGTIHDSIRETYWFCPKCGMQFRDLDELQSLFIKEKRTAKIFGVLDVFFVLMIILIIISLVNEPGSWIFFIFLAPTIGGAFLSFVFIYFWASKNAKEHEKQYMDLLPKVRHKL